MNFTMVSADGLPSGAFLWGTDFLLQNYTTLCMWIMSGDGHGDLNLNLNLNQVS